MKHARTVLVFGLVVAYSVLSAQNEAASFNYKFSVILSVVILVWLATSRRLLRFIDRRNHTRKIQGAVGFLALLVSIIAIEWFVFRLKATAGLSADASASFRSDSAWLVLFPLISYYGSAKKQAGSRLARAHA